MEGYAKVEVSCRLRPPLDPQLKLVKWNLSDTTIGTQKRRDSLTRRKESNQDVITETQLDHVFDDTKSTEEVYLTAFQNIVRKSVSGLNGCILAYGQTSSGKTHSMIGNLGHTNNNSIVQAQSHQNHGKSQTINNQNLTLSPTDENLQNQTFYTDASGTTQLLQNQQNLDALVLSNTNASSKGIMQLAIEDVFTMLSDAQVGPSTEITQNAVQNEDKLNLQQVEGTESPSSLQQFSQSPSKSTVKTGSLQCRDGLFTAKAKVKFSLCEVYMEKVTDLLSNSGESGSSKSSLPSQNLSVKERNFNEGGSRQQGLEFYVEGLSEHDAYCSNDITTKIAKAETKRRRVAATKYNEQSSRSHTVLTLTIERKDDVIQDHHHHHGSSPIDVTKVGKLVFVDLAGNEKLDEGMQYLHEGSMINLSLFFLGECISKLSQRCQMEEDHGGILGLRPTPSYQSLPSATSGGQSASDRDKSEIYIPYRDSKLTRILSVHLGQNSHTGILVCLHPGEEFLEQSMCSLRFAQKAGQVTLSFRTIISYLQTKKPEVYYNRILSDNGFFIKVSRVRPVYRSKDEELVVKLRGRIRKLERELTSMQEIEAQSQSQSQLATGQQGVSGQNGFVSNSKELDKVVTALHRANGNYKETLKRYRSFLTVLHRRFSEQEEQIKPNIVQDLNLSLGNAPTQQQLDSDEQANFEQQIVPKNLNFEKMSDIALMQEVGRGLEKLFKKQMTLVKQHKIIGDEIAILKDDAKTFTSRSNGTNQNNPNYEQNFFCKNESPTADSQTQNPYSIQDENRRIISYQQQNNSVVVSHNNQANQEMEQENMNLKQEIVDLRAELRSVTQELETAQIDATLQPIAETDKDILIDDLRKKIQKLEQDGAGKDRSNISHVSSPSKSSQASQINSVPAERELKQQNTNLRSLNKYLAGEKDRYKIQCDRLEFDVKQKKKEIDGLKKQLEVSEESLKRQGSYIDQHSSMVKENDDLKNRISQKEDEVSFLKNELKSALVDAAGGSDSNTVPGQPSKADFVIMQKKLDEREKMLIAAKQDAQNFSDENKSLHTEGRELREKLGEMMAQRRDDDRKWKKLQQQNEALQNEIATKETEFELKIAELEEHGHNIKNGGSASNEDAGTLLERAERLQEKVDKLHSQSGSGQQQNLSSRINSNSSKDKSQQSDRKQRLAQMADKDGNNYLLDELQNELKSIEQAKKRSESQNSELAEKIAALQQSERDKADYIEGMHKKHHEIGARVTEAIKAKSDISRVKTELLGDIARLRDEKSKLDEIEETAFKKASEIFSTVPSSSTNSDVKGPTSSPLRPQQLSTRSSQNQSNSKNINQNVTNLYNHIIHYSNNQNSNGQVNQNGLSSSPVKDTLPSVSGSNNKKSYLDSDLAKLATQHGTINNVNNISRASKPPPPHPATVVNLNQKVTSGESIKLAQMLNGVASSISSNLNPKASDTTNAMKAAATVSAALNGSTVNAPIGSPGPLGPSQNSQIRKKFYTSGSGDGTVTTGSNLKDNGTGPGGSSPKLYPATLNNISLGNRHRSYLN